LALLHLSGAFQGTGAAPARTAETKGCMRKARVVAKDVDKVARTQAETVLILRMVGSILTRGFFGRMRWLLMGR
jgi:hypothetical protein